MPNSHKRTWIVVADGQQAQVYTRQSEAHDKPVAGQRGHFDETTQSGLHPVRHMHFEAESAKAYDVQHDTVEPKTDVRDKVKFNIARVVADKLNSALSACLYDDLVLVAPPETLGNLRGLLSKTVLAAVTLELAKDLTKFSAQDINRHIGDQVPGFLPVHG